jgi:predicted alpha/beta hydrolase family esterase
MSSPVLILPGIGNSGPLHWQSLWEQANPSFIRIQQRDWDNPTCEEWVSTLESAVKSTGPNVVLVAHSLACLTIAHWAAGTDLTIKAALLVAVPDPSGPSFPKEAVGFAKTPMKRLAFPSIIVASDDDPYATSEYTAGIAKAWGSKLVNIGNRGHI